MRSVDREPPRRPANKLMPSIDSISKPFTVDTGLQQELDKDNREGNNAPFQGYR